MAIKRGDIWLVDLNPVQGSEQQGTRPCLVISNDVTNEYSPTVCVVPLTSNLEGQRFAVNVVLSRADTGLKRDSLLLGGQLRTIARQRLIRRLSAAQAERMPDIERAIKLYLGFSA